MDWSQIIFLLAVIVGTGAAAIQDRWWIVVAMWINFTGTLALSQEPLADGVLDIAIASFLLYIGGREAKTISALYVVMIFIYPISGTLGIFLTYAIIDLIGLLQLIVAGSGGFGKLYRCSIRTICSLCGIDNSKLAGSKRDFN